VSCGCFLGTIAEFRAKVTDTHGNNKHTKWLFVTSQNTFIECATNRVFKIIPTIEGDKE